MLSMVNPDSRPHFIRLEDIFKIMEKRTKDADSMEDVVQALKMFDKDKDGKITVREMRFALANMGNQMSTEEVDEFIGVAATEEFISIEEFSKTITGK